MHGISSTNVSINNVFLDNQESRVDHDWVGLRPCREGGVRIEEETFNIGGHPCQVYIHVGTKAIMLI